MLNRRSFLTAAGSAAAGTILGPKVYALASSQSQPAAPVAANDHIQIALIGAGGQGQGDTRVAVQVPGVKLVAVADCYDGRLEHSKELWGNDIFTTRDYKEILARKDIDAVIIGTPDHWHKQVAVDAMKAGKDVYCEKPMIHSTADGPEMIEAARASNRILQVGSQRVSSIIYAKAKELLASGAIGQLNMVTAHWDRNSSIGAWNYTVPLDASTETCDWPRFLGTAPKIPFNAEHFFQWRKWKAYGSGVAGDLFVHLFSGTHFITGSNGPTRAMATGGLRFWKDGRDANDVHARSVRLSRRIQPQPARELRGRRRGERRTDLHRFGRHDGDRRQHRYRQPHSARERARTISSNSFTDAMQKQILEAYHQKYPPTHPSGPPAVGYEKYVAPAGYRDSYDHFKNFFAAVRSRQPVVEDAVFGYRAAGAALLSNLSVERGAVVKWDPETMKLAA